eukprot:GFUD01004983.1.p1 GENE.GFUD01004983.1~~GFUD01004983.1.p1  ORF type:complete len:294 (-),score=63.28 GFUD01004983.1:286-1167(-)
MDADTIEGGLPQVHSAWCLLISTLILALTVITTSTLRSLVRYSLPQSLPSYCLLDLLCGLEACVCSFELGVIIDIYNLTIYSVFLWILLVWRALSWGDATANPYSHLLRWQAGTQPAVQAIVRMSAGAAGALSSYMVLATLWKYELSHFHEGRALRISTNSCQDDLQVSMISGTFVELLGTLLCFLASFLLSDLPQLRAKPLLITCLDNAVVVGMVILAVDLTGGYFNPAMALGMKLGCGKGGHLQHLVVYWLGPCVGALIAFPVYNLVKAVFASEKKAMKMTRRLESLVKKL